MKLRLEAEGRATPARIARDPELGRHVRAHAAAARQRLGARARARRRVRRDALGQRRARPGPRHARPRGDLPARPRRPPDRGDRLRRPPRRAHAPRASGSRCRASSRFLRLPAARACSRSRSRPPTSTTSGSRAGLAGFVVPSRLYGILAVGRPVLVSADADSETARLVEEAGCGVVVPPGRPELVAGVIRDVVEGRLSLEGMGERGRRWVEREADREVAFGRYRARRRRSSCRAGRGRARRRRRRGARPRSGSSTRSRPVRAHRCAPLGVAGEELEALGQRVRVAAAGRGTPSRLRRPRPGRRRRSSRRPAGRRRAPR